MRKVEQRLWDRLRNNIAPRGVRLERIENLVSDGIPDVHALCAGLVTWMELKAVEGAPARATTALLGAAKGLNVKQRNWHLDWARHGGRSLILVGCGSRIQLAIDGRWADEVNSWPLAELTARAMTRDWERLALHLGAKGEQACAPKE